MRVIVAGSRNIKEMALVEKAIAASGFKVTELVSGNARGVDLIGEVWAIVRNVPVKRFPANWNIGLQAGHLRNQQMAEYASALVAVWDGKSTGTRDMIERATKLGLKVYVEVV